MRGCRGGVCWAGVGRNGWPEEGGASVPGGCLYIWDRVNVLASGCRYGNALFADLAWGLTGCMLRV